MRRIVELTIGFMLVVEVVRRRLQQRRTNVMLGLRLLRDME
jgi:hypothetical protein